MDWLTANRDPSPRGRVPTTRQSTGALRNCPRNLDLIGSTPVVGRRLKSTFGLQAAQRAHGETDITFKNKKDWRGLSRAGWRDGGRR